MESRALIIGGDKRQMYLKKYLESKFSDVYHICTPADAGELSNIELYSHIILPVPITKDKEYLNSEGGLCLKISDIVGMLESCHMVYGSGFDSRTLDILEDKKIEYRDFMKDKVFKRANAYLTAQGTLRLMLDNTDDYIVGKKALIIGFGDVADTLAYMLKGLGLDVYITARNKRKLSLAALAGYKTMAMSTMGNCSYLFDYIFGTVPVNLLKADDIKNMKDDSIYIELASPPYTAEKSHFEVYSKKYLNGSSLPGRFLPEASGKLLAEFILSNL